jgi:uncharacterized protein (TIRG00374 family)
MHHFKNIIIQALKLSFAVGLIVWLVKSGRLEFQVLTQLLELKYLVPLILLTGVNLALGSERWRILLHAKGIQISRFGAAKLTLIATFFNFAIPGGVGGDVVKGFYISKYNPHARVSSLASVIMDRFIGLYCMISYGLVSMIVFFDHIRANPKLHSIMILLTVIFVIFSLAWLLVFSQRISNSIKTDLLLEKLPFGRKLSVLYKDLISYRYFKMAFIKAVFLTVCAQTAAVFFFVVAGSALGYNNVSLSIYFFVVPIGLIITAIPISPAGVGIGQAAFFFLFNSVIGGESQLGSATITALQLATFMYAIIGAFFYLSAKQK